ncbi:MAG: hypothetical protein Ta2B_29350 [Termitinemataceae bacterium]|nr:MAG: hypothetical protein Ta2B_29350 [Termitinemataceae bacterium]
MFGKNLIMKAGRDSLKICFQKPLYLNRNMMRSPQDYARCFLLLLIKIYKAAISPYIPRCCRFYPSCSVYASQAVQQHGAFYGSVLAIIRLLRCQPFSRGGYDPVPEDVPHIADFLHPRRQVKPFVCCKRHIN